MSPVEVPHGADWIPDDCRSGRDSFHGAVDDTEIDSIADTELIFGQHEQTSEEVLDDGLGPEADSETEHPGGGDGGDQCG